MKHLSSICAARARLRFCRGALLVLLWFMATPCLLAQSSVLGSFRADDLAFSQSPVNTPGPNRSPQPHGAAGSQGLLSATNYRLSYWSKTTDPQNAVRRWSIPLAREVAGPASQAFFQVNVTDARVLWEPVSRRFIVVAMRRNGPDTEMHLAASTVEDPAIAPDTNNRAQWRFTSFSTRTSAENYPVIAASDFHCGVDAANLCVVASLAQVTEGPPGTWTLGYTQGARTFAVDRQKVLAGQSSTPRTYSYGLLFGEGSFGFSGERGAMAGPRTAFSQANRTFGASYEKDYDVFGDDHYLRLHVYDDLTGSFRHDHDDIEIDTVYPSNPDPLPDGSDPPALEHHVVDALTVRRGGTEQVWVALHQAEEYRPVPGGFAAAGPGRVRVLRVDVNGSSSGLAFDHFFKLGAEEDFYCAGLSANAAGDVCVAFVGSEATQYPRTYYSIIRPDGTVEPMTALDAPTANASGGFVWGPTISISPAGMPRSKRWR